MTTMMAVETSSLGLLMSGWAPELHRGFSILKPV
jgi:hypothetical protein